MSLRKEYEIVPSGSWTRGWTFFISPTGREWSGVMSEIDYADRRGARKALKRFLKNMGHDIADWTEVKK